MIAPDFPPALSECEQILLLLARRDKSNLLRQVLHDAQEIRRLLSLYSFRSPQRAERLCAEMSSRYHEDILALYGSAAYTRRQSSSVYLRLEQQLPLLARVAALRLSRAGVLNLSSSQLLLSDGMLLCLIQKATAGGN